MEIAADHKLRIARSELPPQVENLIREALEIPNIERQKQMEQNIPGWQRLPKVIPLYEWDGNNLVMPRGFQNSLLAGLDAMGIAHDFIDNTVFEEERPQGDRIELRPWQTVAVEKILAHEQGIWKAPAGSGKTVGVLEAIRRLNCSSIVLVNTLDILKQWVERAKAFLGDEYPIGTISGKGFEISDYLTVATAQTISRRYLDLAAQGFFDQFSFVCLDECHHATADTYNRIVNRFSARYRIGVSATPDKTGDFALATNVLGPVIHETKRKDVTTLVDPVVYRIPTAFKFKYRSRMGSIPSNYPQLLDALVHDDERNALIVGSIMLNQHRHNLVCSRRLEHLHIIGDALQRYGYKHKINFLTGQDSKEYREAAIDYAALHPCVILSTLADEALDIPRLDGLFLIFPQRNPGLIEQQAGRIARQHPDKTDAAIFDFCDPLIGPLESQWQSRRRDVYQKLGYNITTVTKEQVYEGLLDLLEGDGKK